MVDKNEGAGEEPVWKKTFSQKIGAVAVGESRIFILTDNYDLSEDGALYIVEREF